MRRGAFSMAFRLIGMTCSGRHGGRSGEHRHAPACDQTETLACTLLTSTPRATAVWNLPACDDMIWRLETTRSRPLVLGPPACWRCQPECFRRHGDEP